MLIYPHTLSIITTHKCTAACDHCCFHCSPRLERHIPVPRIHQYIEQATEVASLRLVVFTGGECFLLGRDLDELVGTTTRNGLRSRFVSNGFWAVSPGAARKRLDKLVHQGLGEANFSTGDAHERYVKPEYVVNGAAAAAEMGLPVSIMIELRSSSTFDLDAFLQHPSLQPHLASHRISIQYSPWMRFRGAEELHYPEPMVDLYSGGRRGEGCSTIMNVLAINPDEHLIACCGLTFEEIPDLHIGSLRQRSIAQILRGVKDDFIKIWIHLQGPAAILQYARTIDPSIPEKPNMAHICEVCRFIYHDERVVRAVMANPPPNKKDIVQQYVMSLMKPVQVDNYEHAAQMYMNRFSADQARETRRMACEGV
jgi:hypothetical protein